MGDSRCAETRLAYDPRRMRAVTIDERRIEIRDHADPEPGAAGGVGTAAVQLGRAAGARVTATVRNEALRAGVADLGALVIEPEGFEARGPFDVILELVGAPNLAPNLGALATWGRIVVIG